MFSVFLKGGLLLMALGVGTVHGTLVCMWRALMPHARTQKETRPGLQQGEGLSECVATDRVVVVGTRKHIAKDERDGSPYRTKRHAVDTALLRIDAPGSLT